MRHTPFTLALTKRNARPGRLPLRDGRISERDRLQLEREREIERRTPGRTERSASAFAIQAPPKPRVTDENRRRNKGARVDRWADVVATHDPSQRRPIMVRSSEIRPPIVRSYTGGKDGGASEPTANNLRDNIAAQASRSEKWNLALSGIVRTKLGDGKG